MVLWVKNMDFSNGVIELDIKGKNEPGNSFLGLAFHSIDDKHYDAVYFRPFNFKSEEKKDNAVQYINAPDNDWYVLRNKYPGVYENEATPTPDPESWFHIRIEIKASEIKAFIDGHGEATLKVNKIGNRTSGMLGLWVDSDEGWFRNFEVKKQ